jgi:hypothetical protein
LGKSGVQLRTHFWSSFLFCFLAVINGLSSLWVGNDIGSKDLVLASDNRKDGGCLKGTSVSAMEDQNNDDDMLGSLIQMNTGKPPRNFSLMRHCNSSTFLAESVSKTPCHPLFFFFFLFFFCSELGLPFND